MTLKIKKFGEMLISRPEGRDAALVISNQFIQNLNNEIIELDFEGVKVLTPSWLDEIIQVILKKTTKEKIIYLNTTNSSVSASIEMVVSLI
jgi:STAS-like domain of unknown function (DUF4325)